MRKSKKTIVLIMSLCAGLLMACTTEEVIFDERIQREQDLNAIEAFLATHNIDAATHASGFKYVVTDPGSGDPIDGYCRWYLKLTVYHLDSTFAFSNYEEVEQMQGFDVPLEEFYTVYPCGYFSRPRTLHSLDGLIAEGGKIQLFVPSGLAWGTEGHKTWRYDSRTQRNSYTEIPPNTNVLISAELIEVQ